jgi:phage terminase large subunit
MEATDEPVQSTWIGTVTYEWLREQGAPRVLVHRGGTRSGKTYNSCIAWATYLATRDERLSIVRKTLPALKASVLKDMIEVLGRLGLYDPERHHHSNKEIRIPGGGIIDYFPTDDEQKVRGRSRDHLWGNEANELGEPAWRQLVLRTEGRVMLDFNPSHDAEHWIVRRYEGSGDARWFTSTYKDNLEHLPSEQIREIENLKETDPWAWKVYGLGKRARPATSIYENVEPLNERPDIECYGLDFGYNDPMSLGAVRRRDAVPQPKLDVWCLLHERYLTTSDLIDRMNKMGVSTSLPMYCDSAEPDRIEQLKRAGYNAKPAKKGKGSVKAGIDWMKQHAIRVGGPLGEEARREFRNYRWQTRDGGQPTDEPVDTDDHAPDMARYAAHAHYARSRTTGGGGLHSSRDGADSHPGVSLRR